MQTTAKAIVYETGADIDTVDVPLVETLRDLESRERLAFIAAAEGDLTPYMSGTDLAAIAGQCLKDYRDDLVSREDWETKARAALKRAKQEPEPDKTWPWKGASNASFPLLTTSSIQFAARAIPAIVRGDEAVFAKPVGSDKGLPVMGPDGQPMLQGPDGRPFAQSDAQAIPPEAAQALQPMWQRPPGAKAKRAARVRDFMNYTLFYRMKGWEEDTDTLVHHLPIVGCGFRKIYYDRGQQAKYVPALKLVAPMDARSCEEAPRLTEIREGLRLNDIIGDQRKGTYREVALVEQEDDQGLRTLLEQHCLLDLDEDGYAEPYIVTLDEASEEVLRVEANFGEADVALNDDGLVTEIRRECYYVKYDFLPNLDGGFYGLGLGHLLDNITKIVNNTINQMIDAGTAQAAGGGFIGSGVDLSSGGKRGASIAYEPGKYRTVSATGSALREAIYERTFPGPNPVTFQVLDLMLGAAKDISSVKDVLTGEARNTGQVGTTLALIEQGLQVFTAIYKRIYRSLKEEFDKLFRNIGKYGGESAQADYLNVLDDPAANFDEDFNATDFDIRPVSDPTNVTKMQRAAFAQYLGQFLGAPGVNPQAIMKRMFEAQGVEDIDELFMPPPQPDPLMMAGAQAKIGRDTAAAEKDTALAEKARVDAAVAAEAEGRAKLEQLGEYFRKGYEGTA